VTRYNSKRAVFVAAPQKEGQNVFEVKERIHGELDKWQKDASRSTATPSPSR
jgi:multidrug efflux pump subunit AcrB